MLGLTFLFHAGYKCVTEQDDAIKSSYLLFVIGKYSLTLLSLSLK